MKRFGKTKVFDGKKFNMFGEFKKKGKVNEMARKLKRNDNSLRYRITLESSSYILWVK